MANIFNPIIPVATGIKNFLGFPGTHETRDQEEWMRKLILNKIRKSGRLDGGIDYTDYSPKTSGVIDVGSPFRKKDAGMWEGGLFGPARAYGTTLGLADYSVPQQGGKVNWTGGTGYDFHPGDLPGKIGEAITNVVNRGGLFNLDKNKSSSTYGTPQHYIPNITITPKEIQNIFGGGKMLHKNEEVIGTHNWWEQPVGAFEERQAALEDTSNTPVTTTTQLVDKVLKNKSPVTPVTVPAYNPPQGPAGFTRPTRSPAQQAAAVDRKSANMGVKSPIRYNSGTKYGFGL